MHIVFERQNEEKDLSLLLPLTGGIVQALAISQQLRAPHAVQVLLT